MKLKQRLQQKQEYFKGSPPLNGNKKNIYLNVPKKDHKSTKCTLIGPQMCQKYTKNTQEYKKR